MKKLLKKMSEQKIGDIRKELARAHLIVVLLSFSIIAFLIRGVTSPISIEPLMAIVSCILLSIVILISIATSFKLYFCNKK